MNHWDQRHSTWWRIGPPLRPNSEVTQTFQRLVGSPASRVLLLGVTAELAHAFDAVCAIDKSSGMIGSAWPGNSTYKHANLGNWLDMPLPEQPFDAVIGDGSLNNLVYPGEVREVLRRSLLALRPGGRFVCRLFERPAEPPGFAALRADGMGPARINFHAFKWRLAMQLAAVRAATIPVTAILEAFEELFPDRDALAARTGWPRDDIDTIDAYRGSGMQFSFMSRSEMLAVLPSGIGGLRFESSGSYDLADCCPMMSFVRP